RLTVLATKCSNNDFANVEFRVESASTKPISRYEVHMFTNYDGKVEGDTSTSTTTTQPDTIFTRDQTRSDSLGVSLKREWLGDPKLALRLSVTSVIFADGSVWTQPQGPH